MRAPWLTWQVEHEICITILAARREIERRMSERKPYRTRTGKVLIDAEVEAIADDAERDHDVDILKTRRRGRPSMGSAAAEVVPVRLDPELKKAVETRAERDQTTTSEVIREAIRKFLGVA